jgi:hypothetical protein
MPIITTNLDDGSTRHQIEGTGLTFAMPAAESLVLVDNAARHYLSALTELDEFIGHRSKVSSDAHLSPVGRESKLRPYAEKLIDRQAQVWGSLAGEEVRLNSTEAELLAPPALDNGHTVMGIEDSEVRSYWRGLPTGDRMKILDQMQADPERHTRIALALLRSPIELIDHEAQMVRAVWDARQRAKNPEKAMLIDVKRKAIEYGRRGAAQVASMALVQSGIKADEVRVRLATHTDEMARNGFGAFGFNAQQMQRERLLQQQLAAAARK